MFQQIFPLAQSAPISMHVSVEGDKLRVFVQQKTSKKGSAISLTVTGTPEELDDELAGAIEAEAGAVSAAGSVADQVRAQLAAGGKTAAATAPAAERGTNGTPAPAPKPGSVAARKQECIDDYVKLATDPKTASKLNREYFIEKAKTSRNFERLYGNWTKFKKAGDKAAEAAKAQVVESASEGAQPQAAAPDAANLENEQSLDDKTLTLPGVEQREDAAGKETAAGSGPEVSPEPQPEPPPPPPSWSVELTDGTLLFEGPQTREPAIGNELDHGGTTYRVIEVRNGLHRLLVRPKLMNVALEDGTVLCAEMRDLEPGDAYDVKGVSHTVLRAEATRYIVLAPKVRKVIDEEGEQLGMHTGEVEADALIDSPAGGQVKVLRVTDKAVFVGAVTPISVEA